jgi:hypothetical protein
MNERAFERMLQGGGLTPEDILRHTAAGRIDEVVAILKRHRPADEVCRALYERIGGAPLQEFETLKVAYFKHCSK